MKHEDTDYNVMIRYIQDNDSVAERELEIIKIFSEVCRPSVEE
ncbi:MAG: hypothetical protein V3V74_07730 [Nitrosomonadaceae bacterium]